MTNGHLSNFVTEQMAQRKMGLRQFAELCNVSHSTLHRMIYEAETYKPTFEIVARIARGTHTDIRTLAAILAPDVVLGANANALLLAERISRLSPDAQKIIDSFLIGEAFKNRNEQK